MPILKLPTHETMLVLKKFLKYEYKSSLSYYQNINLKLMRVPLLLRM